MRENSNESHRYLSSNANRQWHTCPAAVFVEIYQRPLLKEWHCRLNDIFPCWICPVITRKMTSPIFLHHNAGNKSRCNCAIHVSSFHTICDGSRMLLLQKWHNRVDKFTPPHIKVAAAKQFLGSLGKDTKTCYCINGAWMNWDINEYSKNTWTKDADVMEWLI